MIAHFIKIPPLNIVDEPEKWTLADECIYQSALLDAGGAPIRVVVPEGFETDLASIPRIARVFIVKNGLHRAAAIVHDYLCRLGLLFSRVQADRIFLEAMKVCGVPLVRRRLMFWAVSINTARLRLIGKARK